jgi:hypothetical protein
MVVTFEKPDITLRKKIGTFAGTFASGQAKKINRKRIGHDKIKSQINL